MSNILLTRFDRTVLNERGAIQQHAEESLKDTMLLYKRLFGYFAFSFQYNWDKEDLFGHRMLDLERFAKVFGYTKESLKNPCSFPEQFRDKSPEEIESILQEDTLAGKNPGAGMPAWTTKMDNALYNLFYNPVRYQKKGKTFDQETTSELYKLEVLEELKKFYVNKTRKAAYEYKLAKSFIVNTANYFVNIDFDVYRKLTIQEMDVYLHLEYCKSTTVYQLNTKNYGGQLPAEIRLSSMTIDFLADRWNIARPQNHGDDNPFRFLKQRINLILESINRKAGYRVATVEWQKARVTDRFEGQPVIVMPLNTEADKKRFCDPNATLDRLKFYVAHFLREHFRKQYPKPFVSHEDVQKRFIEYLLNPREDTVNKKKIIFDTLRVTWRTNATSENYEEMFGYLPGLASELIEQRPKEIVF